MCGPKALGELNAPSDRQVEIAASQITLVISTARRMRSGIAAHFERLRLPLDFDYMQVAALCPSGAPELQSTGREALGQASRISGVTPAAISLLMVHPERRLGLCQSERRLPPEPGLRRTQLEQGVPGTEAGLAPARIDLLMSFMDLLQKWNKVYNPDVGA